MPQALQCAVASASGNGESWDFCYLRASQAYYRKNGDNNGGMKMIRPCSFRMQGLGIFGGADGARTRDPRRDRPVF